MKFHHHAVPIVLSVALIDAIGFGIVLPVLPSLIVELSHVSLADAARIGGYMLVAYSMMQFFAGPILGSLGDAIGRRRVLLFSSIAFAADYALMAAAPTIAWLFLGRAIAGVAGATFPPASAALADVTPPEKRGATFAMMGAAFGIGFILGPAIGGLLAGWGTRAPFIAAAGLAACNAVWILVALPETLAPENRRPFDWRKANVVSAFRPLLHTSKTIGWLLAAAFLWQFSHMVYPATWAFWAEIALGWSAQQIGWSLAASGTAMAIVQMTITGRAIAKYGEERTVVMGMLAAGLVFVGYIFARETWMIYALIAVSSFQALVFPSMNALVSRMTDASRQGQVQGGMSALGSVAWVLSPYVLSQALAFGAERGFDAGNFALAGALVFIALIIVALRVVPRVVAAPETA